MLVFRQKPVPAAGPDAAAISASSGLTANTLKAMAMAAMVLDHYAVGFLCEGSEAWILLRILGRLTMPIICLLIAEDCTHTSSLPRYAARLLAFAVLSHLPYTAFFGLDPLQNTSVIWGLLMGLLALALWRQRQVPLPLRVIGVVLLAWLATPADWGYITVFWVLCFGCFRQRPALRLWAFTASGVLFYLLPVVGEVLATPYRFASYGYRLGFLLAIPLLAGYHGVLGRRNAALQYGFYVFYPAHLILLCLLKGACG